VDRATRTLALVALIAGLACKRDPRMELMEAPPDLQPCVPKGDRYASVLEVRFGADGRGVATLGCFSTSHDAACIKEYVARSSKGAAGETKRMLIMRSVATSPAGATHVGMVTFAEVMNRPFSVLGDCTMRPL